MTYNQISDHPVWHQLHQQAADLKKQHMRDLFATDADRFSKFSMASTGLFLDYAKNKITDEVKASLLALAETTGLEKRRTEMFDGEKINETENRSVLHVALRANPKDRFQIAGQDILPQIVEERRKMATFCQAIHTGTKTGFSGARLDTVVNIGIGGSDLGPAMVTEALKPFAVKGRRSFFVSNVDGTHLSEVLQKIDPARTLFVVASKTFTTQETMTNANSARSWFLRNGGTQQDIAKHFVALSTNTEKVEKFGIDRDNIFQFWDWVGGRYSLWSAIGLSIALQIGWKNFERLLSGAREMDMHFKNAPLAENMPALLALIGIWNRNFLNISAHAVLPYDQYLHRLPAYLQQADMESNGKSVTMDGEPVAYATGPIIFGEPGTNGQHAFYQLLHQGTDKISTDFIASALSHNDIGDHQQKLLANFLAQPEALMRGKNIQEVMTELVTGKYDAAYRNKLVQHKYFAGDRPSNAILMVALTPETLGALIALYEHKIFCQGVIWGINSFDQWGVELGKVLAQAILPEIDTADPVAAHDCSTNGLLNLINKIRAGKTDL